MELYFTKLQGNGNDFILVDEFEKVAIPDEMKADFAGIYCDRRYGIGGDGVLYLSKSDKADLRMRLFQPDKSEAEMCGNGIRCFAKYAIDMAYMNKTGTVETPAGIIGVDAGYRKDSFFATIAMPEAKFQRKDIPAKGDGEYLEKIGGFDVYAVNTGVPHAVIFVDDPDSVDIEKEAPPIRHHKSFSNGANVNFVAIKGEDGIRIRTYERGIEGETLSCGTGATASAAVAHKLGKVGKTVKVDTPGGPLTIHFDGGIRMEGPATTVFFGEIVF